MRPTASPMGTPVFSMEAYDFIFETGLAIARASTGTEEAIISLPAGNMLLGVAMEWEKRNLTSVLLVQSAYDFSTVYRTLLTPAGMEIRDGKIVNLP